MSSGRHSDESVGGNGGNDGNDGNVSNDIAYFSVILTSRLDGLGSLGGTLVVTLVVDVFVLMADGAFVLIAGGAFVLMTNGAHNTLELHDAITDGFTRFAAGSSGRIVADIAA